jgi:Domain of unknown function (DUF4166)
MYAALEAQREWRPAAGTAGHDAPFRALLGAQWDALPRAVQCRFARHLSANASIAYRGEIISCTISRAGWWLAQFARLIGAPLPLCTDTGVAATVSVTGDRDGASQHWTRQYGRLGRAPQMIHSTKRFAGPTGIEEYLGHGIGIALTLRVEQGALLFESDHMFLALGPWRLRLPRWLTPGRLTVAHIDMGGGRFAFTLDLTHRNLGTLLHQVALFADMPEGALR